MKGLLVSKSNRQRQKILQILNRKTDGQKFRPEGIKEAEWFVPVSEICEELGISYVRYRFLYSDLWDNDQVNTKAPNGKECAFIRDKGISAVNTQFYLKRGQKNIMEMIKNGIIVLGFFIAGYSFFSALSSRRDNKDLQRQINQLEYRLDTLSRHK